MEAGAAVGITVACLVGIPAALVLCLWLYTRRESTELDEHIRRLGRELVDLCKKDLKECSISSSVKSAQQITNEETPETPLDKLIRDSKVRDEACVF